MEAQNPRQPCMHSHSHGGPTYNNNEHVVVVPLLAAGSAIIHLFTWHLCRIVSQFMHVPRA